MSNMKNEFITYEQALDLKELGFDEPCFGYYVDGELRGINLGIEELGGVEPYYQRFGFHTLSNHDIFNSNKIVVTAPSYSQAFRWFREKHNLHSYIEGAYPWFRYYINSEDDRFEGHRHLLIEEAEQACLDNLIEIVKHK